MLSKLDGDNKHMQMTTATSRPICSNVAYTESTIELSLCKYTLSTDILFWSILLNTTMWFTQYKRNASNLLKENVK